MLVFARIDLKIFGEKLSFCVPAFLLTSTVQINYYYRRYNITIVTKGERKMTVITTTLYYEDIHGKDDKYHDDYFLGRALTKDEYDNITVDELRAAIIHSVIDSGMNGICVRRQKRGELSTSCQPNN